MEPSAKIMVRHCYMTHSDKLWRITAAARIHGGSDWAAYLLASDEDISEVQALDLCLSRGNKLPEDIARATFTNVDEKYRR